MRLGSGLRVGLGLGLGLGLGPLSAWLRTSCLRRQQRSIEVSTALTLAVAMAWVGVGVGVGVGSGATFTTASTLHSPAVAGRSYVYSSLALLIPP